MGKKYDRIHIFFYNILFTLYLGEKRQSNYKVKAKQFIFVFSLKIDLLQSSVRFRLLHQIWISIYRLCIKLSKVKMAAVPLVAAELCFPSAVGFALFTQHSRLSSLVKWLSSGCNALMKKQTKVLIWHPGITRTVWTESLQLCKQVAFLMACCCQPFGLRGHRSSCWHCYRCISC